MWFPSSSASSPTRSLTFGRWGCGERCHLSHAVGDSAVVLSGMSRQIALQTRSEALRRTRRGLNARQGMEGAKTLTERFRRSGAPIPLARGFQVARNRASPCKAHLHGTSSHWLVGGRRPSVLQRWGVWGSPQTVSGCAQGAAGTVAARSFWRSGSKNTQGILRRQKSNVG